MLALLSFSNWLTATLLHPSVMMKTNKNKDGVNKPKTIWDTLCLNKPKLRKILQAGTLSAQGVEYIINIPS